MSNSRGIRAGRAFVEIFADDSKVAKTLKKVESRMQTFGGFVSKVGKSLLTSGLARLAPITGGLLLLNSVVTQTRGNVFELMMAARGFGYEMSGGAAVSAIKFVVVLQRVLALVKGVGLAIATALTPELTALGEYVASALDSWIRFIQQNRLLIVSFAKIAVLMIAAGGALVGIGAAMSAAGTVAGVLATVFTTIGSVLAFLVSPIGLVIVGVAGLVTWFLTATDAGQQMIGELVEGFAGLQADVQTAMGGIAAALMSGNLSKAAEILWLMLKLQWIKGIAFLQKTWGEWATSFWQTINEVSTGILILWNETWAGISTAFTETVSFLRSAWTNFAAFFQKTFWSAAGWVAKKIMWVKSLFDSSIDLEAANAAIDQLVESKRASLDTDAQAELDRIEQERQAKRQQIEQERSSYEDALGQQLNDANAKLAQEQANSVAELEKQLMDARQQFTDSVDEAKREAKSGGAAAQRARFAGLQLALNGGKTASQGTFSAFEASGIGGKSIMSYLMRTADASEKTAKNTATIVKQGPGGGNFVP